MSNATEQNTASFDDQELLKRNLMHVFNQRDSTLRMQVIQEIYTPDAMLFDPEAAVQGWQAISDTVDALLARLPVEFAFQVMGPAVGHHGVGRLRWQAGIPGAKPAITGIDVAHLQDGRIQSLYVFIDPTEDETQS